MVEALKGWAFVPANHFNMSAVEVPAHLAGDEAAARMEWALKISLSTPALLGSVFSQCAIHVRCSWPDPQAEAMDALAQSWDDLIPYAFEESFSLGFCALPQTGRYCMVPISTWEYTKSLDSTSSRWNPPISKTPCLLSCSVYLASWIVRFFFRHQPQTSRARSDSCFDYVPPLGFRYAMADWLSTNSKIHVCWSCNRLQS